MEVRLKPKEKFQGPIKVLGISGSPRGKQSRSHKMLETVLAHARSFGAETKTIILSKQWMQLCEGCLSGDEECIFPCVHEEDDTDDILQAIMDADAFVFATPAQWAAPSPFINILIGKMASIEENHYELVFKNGREPLLGKLCVLLVSQDGDGASMALSWLVNKLREMGIWTLSWGQTFKPALLELKLIRFGLRIINERKFKWIDN